MAWWSLKRTKNMRNSKKTEIKGCSQIGIWYTGRLVIIQIWMNASIYIQLWSSDYKWLLNIPCGNEVILRGKNLPLKCCQPLEHLSYYERGFWSFHLGKIESVGVKAAKLPFIKFLEWFRPGPHALAHTLAVMTEAADFFLSPATLIATGAVELCVQGAHLHTQCLGNE